MAHSSTDRVTKAREQDAEEILEGVMRRRNWTVDTRDALMKSLIKS